MDALLWPRFRPISPPPNDDSSVSQNLTQQGEYIFKIAGCLGCHTDEDNDGAALAGGRRFETPLGVFYSPNITPDDTTGIGRWELRDFIRALRYGTNPQGQFYYPVFPYTSYHQMHIQDMSALYTYLQNQTPVVKANNPHELPWYLSLRLVNWGWQKLYFRPEEFQNKPDANATWNRGAYLANALGHCGECHTPRNKHGALDRTMHLAGTRDGPEDETIPNITPDKKTGIGKWTHDDIETLLNRGMTPDGDFTGSLMAEVIDNSTQFLTADDLNALTTYLRAIPPIDHQVKKAKRKNRDEFDF